LPVRIAISFTSGKAANPGNATPERVDCHAGAFEVEVEDDQADKENGNEVNRRRERTLASLVADLEQTDCDQDQKPGRANNRRAVRN
jgi:hypothetical protein